MELMTWIVLGAVAGWIASLMMHTSEEQDAVTNILVGIAGAVVGGVFARFMGADGVSGFNTYSIMIAIIGAVVLLAVSKVFRVGA